MNKIVQGHKMIQATTLEFSKEIFDEFFPENVICAEYVVCGRMGYIDHIILYVLEETNFILYDVSFEEDQELYFSLESYLRENSNLSDVEHRAEKEMVLKPYYAGIGSIVLINDKITLEVQDDGYLLILKMKENTRFLVALLNKEVAETSVFRCRPPVA